MEEKHAGGRPSESEIAQKAGNLSRLGATDEEVGVVLSLLDEDPSVYYKASLWLIRHDRSGIIAHRKKVRAAQRRKARTNPAVRLKEATRSRLWAAMKGKGGGKLFSRLGYSVDDLMQHLEALFHPGMTWDNYGEWHVDHIKPCALFDHLCPKQFAECWALKNLQPLWAKDNVKKGAKYGSP